MNIRCMYLPNPSAQAGCNTRSIFKWSLTGLNFEFSFSQTGYLTTVKEPSLPYYLLIVEGRIVGFIPLPKELAQYEMQTDSSKIWTQVAMSISDDDHHHMTSTSLNSISIYLSIYDRDFSILVWKNRM